MTLAGEPRPARPSVLVVDDKPANLVALSAVLQPLEVRVVEARSGSEAIERVAAEPFAVVLLDVQMPEMDGFEVARRMRASAAGEEVPIIFLTAIHRDEEYARKGYATGAADYITKPFDGDVLRARVKAFVDLFHQRERLRVREVGERTRERDAALERLAELLESERAARLEAEVANRAKDEFLATMSHELRTPLGAILGWAAIARRQRPPAEVDRALETIERNARAQMRIVEDVLDVGRMVRGTVRLELEPTDAAEAIEDALTSARPAAEAKQVTLAAGISPDVGVIFADGERLRQIVANLLSNAIKFTPRNGHVSLSARRVGENVVLDVEDDGEGIRPDLIPQLFEPFRQGDGSSTRRHGGVGLGLAIVRQLVEAHGGTVGARSDGEGMGSTFTVVLPAKASRTSTPRIPVADGPSSRARLEQVRLLVVDDDEDSRDLIACILGERGAEVQAAASAEEALRLLEASPPDVLVSDIGMPDVDGYSLIRTVRAMETARGGGTPAIALTAYARAVDGERALAAGFQAHVMKPVDPDRLVALIARLARGGRPRQWERPGLP
jgi:signal transduction histidine kinase